MIYSELRLLKYRLLITIIFLILCSLAASCQITKVDNGFLITREYAEYIATKFDSLDAYKLAHKECVSKVLECDSLINKSETLIKSLNDKYNIQSEVLLLKNAMIASYERGNIVCNDYANQLKKEKRIKKAWKITAISALSMLGSSLIYISIK